MTDDKLITLTNETFESDVTFDSRVRLLGCTFKGDVRLVAERSHIEGCRFEGEVYFDGVPWSEYFKVIKLPGQE